MALASLARQDGTKAVRLYVTRIYITEGGYDPYGNAQEAEIRRNATVESVNSEAPRWTEAWTVALSSGGELRFPLRYRSGTPSWSAGEATPYSNVKPDFHRIYRFDQRVDLAMSASLGRELDGEMALSSTVAELSGLFDGNERIVAVMDIPMSVREVSLP
ncbi:hypothetical protein OEW28_03225 [Defluviimonas sp. WL0002]|uniref:Uncharacterized protein n=1 Tax=Albidovulum marisflavi TaxID=2984159 RepID=A0ABT2Z908_9RHOB|nr:hypothetical protein [Defluviimonas sp. WL0002]MCV2867635.1 hypothetical protein [Defluviimonas sp. WL0002]